MVALSMVNVVSSPKRPRAAEIDIQPLWMIQETCEWCMLDKKFVLNTDGKQSLVDDDVTFRFITLTSGQNYWSLKKRM